MTDKKFLKLTDYEILDTLGTGGFGRVRLARNKSSNECIALKMMKKKTIMDKKQMDHIYNEIKILSELKHPFIVKFMGFTQDEKYLYMAMEFVNGGELFSYLRNSGKFPVDQARFYIAQIVSIFEYLHSKNIVYRDLKPENILIAKNGYVKLTDFGFAKKVEDRTYTICGTPEYIAPEIILNKGHSKPVDWWALGILLYEMLAGIDPFSGDDPMSTYKNILNGKINFPTDFDKDAKSLVKHLLVADLTKRYGNLKNGVRDIKYHKFFMQIPWTFLLAMKVPAPYIPKIKDTRDISNFSSYPDSDKEAEAIKKDDDPFEDWFK